SKRRVAEQGGNAGGGSTFRTPSAFAQMGHIDSPGRSRLSRDIHFEKSPQSRVVRFYGLYHHTHAEALGHCRAQVGQPPVVIPVARDWQTACAQRGEAHPERCPTCGQRLVCTGVIPRGGAPPPVRAGERAACSRPTPGARGGSGTGGGSVG